MPVGHRCNGRHFADQPLDLQQPVRGIVYMLRIRIDSRQRRHRADKHSHGMAIIAKAFHELLRALVQHGVVCDVIGPALEFRLAGQFSKQQQVGNFQKRAPLRQNFDRIPAVTQYTSVSINIGNAAAARRCVHERRIVGHQPKIFWTGFYLPQAHRTDRAILNGY